MAGGVTLGMIGGFLHQKTPEIVSEYLPVAKMLDGGSGMGDIVKKVVQGGLGSVVPNPMSQVMGQLNDTISQVAGALSGVPGAQGIVSSLTGPGGLAGAASGLLSAGTNLLSGQGVLAVMSHSTMAGLAGDALPEGMSTATVLGPLNASDLVSSVASALPTYVQPFLNGVITADQFVGNVLDHAADLTSVVTASADALTGLADLAPDLSGVHTVAAGLISGPTELQDVLKRAMSPADLQTMLDSLATH